MGMTPEGKIKHRLDKMLKSLGVWYFSPQSGPFGRSGIPDRIVCVCGQFVGIEAKKDRNTKPTALQLSCMLGIEEAGGTCFVVYDDDTIATVRDYLKGILDRARY